MDQWFGGFITNAYLGHSWLHSRLFSELMKKSFLLFSICLFACSFELNAQWLQSQQPTGGRTNYAARVGSEIWLGSLYGIYVSANEGITWHRHPTLLQTIIDFKAKGDSLIMLIQERPSSFVYHLSTMTSLDGGVTWNNPVVAETDNSYYTWGAREIYWTDSSLVINSNQSSYYISLDFGQSWDTLDLPDYTRLDAHSDKYLLSNTYYGPQKGRYYSDNGGQSWNFMDSIYTSLNGAILGNSFFFGCTDSMNQYFVMRTSDFGLTYDTVYNTPYFPNSLEVFDGKLRYISYPNQLPPVITESADSGSTWYTSIIPEELNWINDSRVVLLNNWDWLVCMGTYGIFRYNPASQTAYKTETGILASPISSVEVNKGVIYARTDGSMYRSDNAGSTWTPLPAFINSGAGVEFLGDTILAVTRSFNYKNNLCFSYDNGLTWDSLDLSAEPHWDSPVYLKYYHGKIYAANQNYVGVSADFGVTWDSLPAAVDTSCLTQTFYPERFVVNNDALFLLNAGDNQVVKLDTVTNTWKNKLCYSAPGVTYESLFDMGDCIILRASSTFKYSADTGQTWISPANSGIPGAYKPYGFFAKDGIWYATGPDGIYYSFNRGAVWQQLPTVPEMSVNSGEYPCYAMLNDILYVAGNNIWYRTDNLQLISGHVYFDLNNSSVKEPAEPFLPNRLLYTVPNNNAFSTDSTGFYQFFIGSVGDTLRPALPTPLFTSNPSYVIASGAASNVDFGLYIPPGIQDLTIDITNRTPFRPWFHSYIDINVENHGSNLSPALIKVVLDTSLIYQDASLLPLSVSGDTLTFLTDSISSLEMRSIAIEVQTKPGIPIGTLIHCNAVVLPVTGDSLPADNYSDLNSFAVASFDPNDKSAKYDPYFTPQQLQNGEEMQYVIRFQNTGTFQADFIRIVDTISTFADLATFRLISASHPVRYEFSTGRELTFFFDNINLPPEILDEPNSHGYVKFGIKFFDNLPIGTGIENTAYIYFDFNPPIVTNTVSTLIADPPINVSVDEISDIGNPRVFPNPVSSNLTIQLNGTTSNKTYRVTIYDLSGRLITQNEFTGNQFLCDVSQWADGKYIGVIDSPADKKKLDFSFVVLHR